MGNGRQGATPTSEGHHGGMEQSWFMQHFAPSTLFPFSLLPIPSSLLPVLPCASLFRGLASFFILCFVARQFKQTPLLQRKARNRPASAMPSRPTAGAARAAADAADPHSRSRRPISAPVARSMQAQSRAPGPAYPVAHDYAAQQAYAEVMAGSTYPAEGGGSSTASESDHRPAKRTADGVKVDLAALEAQLNAFDFNWNDDRQEGQGRGGATGGGASPAKQSGNGTYYVPPPSSLDSYADDEFEDLEGTHLVSPSKERPPSPVVSPSKGSGSKAQSSHSPVGAAKPSPAPQKALSPKPREISPSGRPASRQAFNTTAGSAKSHSGPALATGLDEDTDSDIDF